MSSLLMKDVDDLVWGSTIDVEVYSKTRGLLVANAKEISEAKHWVIKQAEIFRHPKEISEARQWVIKQAEIYKLRAAKLLEIVLLLTDAEHEGMDGARRMQEHYERIGKRYVAIAFAMQVHLICWGPMYL